MFKMIFFISRMAPTDNGMCCVLTFWHEALMFKMIFFISRMAPTDNGMCCVLTFRQEAPFLPSAYSANLENLQKQGQKLVTSTYI